MEEEDLPLFVSEVLPSFLEPDFALVEADFESEAEVDADVLPLLDDVEPVLPEVPVPIDDPVPDVSPEPDVEPEVPEVVEEEDEPDPLMLEDDELEEDDPKFEDPLEELPELLLLLL